jgi:FkbM family methyltransferase
MSLRTTVDNKLRKALIMLETPGALAARFAGCYFELFQMVSRIRSMGVVPKTIIDVGANRGMFTRCAQYVFPEASIYAFEPLADCYEELRSLSQQSRKIHCYNVALGNVNRRSTFYRSSYDYSSSCLRMGPLHRKAFPYTGVQSVEKVNMQTLDTVMKRIPVRSPVLMKVDVQGYEMHVMKGAKKSLALIDCLICEISIRPLYEGGSGFDEIYSLLFRAGFAFSGQVGELKHPDTGEILQFDGLFLRRNWAGR